MKTERKSAPKCRDETSDTTGDPIKSYSWVHNITL